MSYLLRIGPIPTINKWFLIHTREWDHRWHLGLDHVWNDCSDQPQYQTKGHWKNIRKGDLIKFMGVIILITHNYFIIQWQDMKKTNFNNKYINPYDFGSIGMSNHWYDYLCMCLLSSHQEPVRLKIMLHVKWRWSLTRNFVDKLN